ncbi:hypothetical protein [Candidatus Methylomicrobium oryzae]|uniref:hypothetical protein n=1 Tax=Candidatus Methylomicrobium oryzae TaxID=2802053 RepID=UPI0019207194|nr:hypothetical protein [Methylomicrobium sp. RS1]MBL1264992.1 hypothetical protein [Methylomicrobium sp. RS1]
MDSFHSYIKKLLFLIIFLLVLTAIINISVDPFELFGSPKIEGFNRLKPEYAKHVRMIKAHQVRIRQPEVLVIGSSRVDLGLDPDHPALMQTDVGAYNLALSSANIYEILRYIQHAHAVKPLKQVVIGLDFFMFNVNKSNEPDFDELRLISNNRGWYKDIINSLLSYDGLSASLSTLTHQREISVSQYLSNGFRDDSQHWKTIQKKGGHRRATINNESYTLKAADGFVFFSIENKNPISSTYEYFKQILLFCKFNNIDLRLFISPEHARKLILIDTIGLWKIYEDWKINLTQLIKLNAPSYSLWDFSGFNQITTEPFPELSDNLTQMRWYWESSHYKKETGNIILNKLLGKDEKERNKYPDFGVQLTLQNIDSILEQNRAQREAYIKQNIEIIKEIKRIIINTSSAREQLMSQNKQLESINYFLQASSSK